MSDVVQYDYIKMPDAELIRILRDRRLPIPTMEDGFLNKRDAAAFLKKYDKERMDNEDRVWVTFFESNHPSAGPYVFASVNDKTMQAPYNTRVCIPKYFLTECIDRAIVKEYRQQEVPGVGFKMTEHKIQTYPYEMHGPATEEDVKKAKAVVAAAKRAKYKKAEAPEVA